jgi:4-carboxymuconolactone decarboxylase
VEPEDWDDATRAELDNVRPVVDGGSRAGAAAPPAARRLHLPSVVARHPTLLGPYMTWAKAIALAGVLPRRDNALLALRTAARCASDFEWGVHADSALRQGALTQAEIDEVRRGWESRDWDTREAALLRAVDELFDDHAVGDGTWAVLSEFYPAAGLLEITFVVGHYTMLSLVANSAGVEPEPQWSRL